MTRPAAIRQSRLRLAAAYLLVIGAILYGAGHGMSGLLMRAHWSAIKSELETLGGTLHDSLKPLLPAEARPSAQLLTILPGLCLVGDPCPLPSSLLPRHAVSIADPERFYLRLLNRQGRLIAHSPGSPKTTAAGPGPVWTVLDGQDGERFLQYSIHLHRSHAPAPPSAQPAELAELDWGYLQIGRSLRGLDAEGERLWWAAQTIVLVALLVAGLASWWLSGLAMQPLLKAYRQQEQFSADAAHELRAPVANLLGVVEAHNRVAPEEQKAGNDMLAVVWGQAQRLNRLITDLLLLAQLEAPEPAAALQECDITQIAADLIEETAEAANAAGVTVQLINNNEAAIRVHGSERELYRLVSNMLLNAVNYTQPGGTISVSLRRERHQLVLQVKDSGIGISTADQQRIFDRFFRSDPSRSRQQGGTGLGLSIVAAIVRRHHGQISVASTLGSGSVFIVKLPATGSGSFRAALLQQTPPPAA